MIFSPFLYCCFFCTFYPKWLVQICTLKWISCFSWKIFLSLPTSAAPARLGPSTKSVQILHPNRFYIIFFTVSYTYDCPVSRYTVQDKPLFVITTIQNRISQTVCTSIEHTIELDIWTENTKSFSRGMETSLR